MKHLTEPVLQELNHLQEAVLLPTQTSAEGIPLQDKVLHNSQEVMTVAVQEAIQAQEAAVPEAKTKYNF